MLIYNLSDNFTIYFRQGNFGIIWSFDVISVVWGRASCFGNFNIVCVVALDHVISGLYYYKVLCILYEIKNSYK